MGLIKWVPGNLILLYPKIVESGTFLEAGAYDGEFLSNTLYLEHEFGWRGVLVEANPDFFHQLLLKRRKSWAINVCHNTKPYPSQVSSLTQSLFYYIAFNVFLL